VIVAGPWVLKMPAGGKTIDEVCVRKSVDNNEDCVQEDG